MLGRADWQVKDPRGIFFDGLNLKIKGIRPVETSVTIYHSTRRKIPEDLYFQLHRCQKLKPLKVKNFPVSLSYLRFNIVFKRARHWTLSLSQKNAVYITIPYGRIASISHFQDDLSYFAQIHCTNLM